MRVALGTVHVSERSLWFRAELAEIVAIMVFYLSVGRPSSGLSQLSRCAPLLAATSYCVSSASSICGGASGAARRRLLFQAAATTVQSRAIHKLLRTGRS